MFETTVCNIVINFPIITIQLPYHNNKPREKLLGHFILKPKCIFRRMNHWKKRRLTLNFP